MTDKINQIQKLSNVNKKSIDSIRRSEIILQGTLDALTAHIAVLDNKGFIKKVNKAWRDFAIANGYKGDSYGVGDNYLDLCRTTINAPEECEILGSNAYQGIKDVISGKKELFEMEYPCHSPTEKRWFIMRVTPYRDDVGSGVVVAHENITKRKLAEEKTKVSESKYRVLTEAIPAFMFVTDKEGLTTFANREWYEYTGFSEEQTKGSGWTNAIHPEDLQGVTDKWMQAVNSSSIFETEYRLRKHTGEYRWYLVRVVPRTDSKGEIIEFVGTGTDIEKRKIIEVELRKSEIFNRVILEGNPDSVKLIDNKGRLQYINENGIEHLEIDDFEKYKNKKWYELWETENQPLVKSAIKDALEGKTARFQANDTTLKGTPKWWDVIVLPIEKTNSEDHSSVLLSVSRDITETKRINEALLKAEVEQRKQAEAANRAKDEFLSIISHELRTPLNAMLGWVRMLKTGILDKSKTEQAVEVIERNIVLQNELIEDLLDVSRIITGKMLIEKEVLNFSTIVSNALDIARPLAYKKGIEISFKNSIGFQKILGDETRLNQVIINLLNNAIKFSSENGSINIDLSEESNQFILKIRDTGIGIKPEFLPHIFERFSQDDSTTKRNFSGLGLGLTIVKHITELHSGSVEVFSEGEGKGSTFTLRFPVFQNEEKYISPQNETFKISTTEKFSLFKDVNILLVDDDLDGLIPLKILLEREKAKVETANSARVALNLLETNNFDILISDIGMPETDGYELIKTLRKSNKNKDIPAIALTAYASLNDKEKALKLGFQKHISKPLDFDELFQILEEIVEATKNKKEN